MQCYAVELGMVEYRAGWRLQNSLAAALAAGQAVNTVLLLEHPHTYTYGRSGHPENLLISAEECARRGITLVEVDRGGDITYHGPGQLVAYPILSLGRPQSTGRLPQADYIGYIRRLETVLIETLRPFGIIARPDVGYTGVWVDTASGAQKIAAIGVRVNTYGISTHGIALNVTTDLSYFAGIIPCGIADRPVTSMQALLGAQCPSMPDVIAGFKLAFASVFEAELRFSSPEDLQHIVVAQAAQQPL